MAQDAVALPNEVSAGEHHDQKNMLGPLLCWAVVFADIGTSVYYTPGILYGSVKSLAGFFVLLTMSVFILLALKYVEVTQRFSQGGGVVTVAAIAINPWVGALGGMFILVDYFLTAAISCLSGMQYLSVVFPPLGAIVNLPELGNVQLVMLIVTVVVLLLLGLLNWVGISESAKVSLVGACIAFVSDLAILFTVFSHLSFGQFLGLFSQMFTRGSLTPLSFLVGFAGAFLAFSGLESISQLSPVMRRPHKRVAGIAMLLVVLTIGLTSPLLAMLSTLLLPNQAADPIQSSQIISLLAGHWGNIFLQTEVAISASALLVFASNTAIIGAYHVFIALSRMEFLPDFILKRNRLRDTPHYSIMLATGIPVMILILVLGNITLLGDMYAFGLLGAFSLTCLGVDIVRAREWRHAQQRRVQLNEQKNAFMHFDVHDNESKAAVLKDRAVPLNGSMSIEHEREGETYGLKFQIMFVLGILTTILVTIAWGTNLIAKPDATLFGGGVTILGMGIAYINYRQTQKSGRVPVPVAIRQVYERLPNATMAILIDGYEDNKAVIKSAMKNSDPENPVVFVFVGKKRERADSPRMMEIIDPYNENAGARQAFGKAEHLALNAKFQKRYYVYTEGDPDTVATVWRNVHPHDTILSPKLTEKIVNINPDRIRYEITSGGKLAHLLKSW